MRGWIPKLAFTLLVVWFSADSSMTSTAGPGSTTLTNSPSTAGQGSTTLTNSTSTAGPGSTALTDSPSTAGPGSTTLTNSTSTAGPGSTTLTDSASTAGPGSTTLTDSASTAGPGSTTLTDSASTAGPGSTTLTNATSTAGPGSTALTDSPSTAGPGSTVLSDSPSTAGPGSTALTNSPSTAGPGSTTPRNSPSTAGPVSSAKSSSTTTPATSTTTSSATTKPVPNPPGTVAVIAKTTTNVTLNITSPSTGRVDCYNVTFTDENGKMETRRTPTNDTLYIVDRLTPGYNYTFTVESVYNGLASTSSQGVPTSTVPSSPCDVTVTDRTTTSVTLTVAPGPGGYDGYRVQTVGGGINRSDTFPHHTSTGPLLVSGLTPGTTFTFTVFTQANGWESEHFYRTQDSTSDKVKRSTVNQAANETTEGPSAPDNVEISSQTNVCVTLTVTLNGSGYDGFLAQYNNLNQSFQNITADDDTSVSHNLPVNELTPGTTYTFEVYTLYNGSKSTNNTGDIGSTVPNPPGHVSVNTQTTTTVTLDITSPSTGGVDYYNVTFTDKDSNNNTRSTPTNDTSYTVEGLTPGYSYVFKVVSVYQDLTSIPYQGVPASTVPNPPGHVSVNNQTTTTVTLDITSPSTGGVDYYNVTFTDKDSNNNTRSTPTNDTSNTVEGLTPGYSYIFKVVSVYQGLTSKPHQGVPASTVPNPPGHVSVNNQTTTTVTLDITSPSTGGVDYYNVTFTDKDSNNNTRSTPTNDTSYTVEGLTPGYSYIFKVVSVYQDLTSKPHQGVPASTVPDVPKKYGCSTTNDSITVTLNSPTPGKVDNYIASEDCSSSGDIISPGVTVSGQNVTIGGLSPGITCNLTVIAVFGGHNSSAAVFSGLGIDEGPPGQVGDLAAQTLSATAISLTWKKPTEPNGDIIQYSVYVTDPVETCAQLLLTVDSTASQDNETCNATRKDTFIKVQSDFNVTINDLLAYTRYTFSVYAYTEAGKGLESSQVSNTSESKPYKITNLTQTRITSSTITISFKEPEPSTGPITTYEVQYVYTERCNNGSSTGKDITHNTTCTPSSGRTVCSIENLYPYWDYSISVRAYTSIGSGNWSDPLPQRTEQDKPSSIGSIMHTGITANSVTLKWSAPCPPNGVISNYVILWNMSSHINTTDNSSSYLVSGLLPYRTYTYQIAAKTGAGKGHYSTEQNFTTLTDVPHQPGEVTVNEKKATSMSVTWGEPDLKTGPTYYVATALDNRSQANTSSCYTNGFDKTTCRIQKLDEFWNYIIVVTATTVNGSIKSNTTIIRTAEAAPGPVTDVKVTVQGDVTKARTVQITCGLPKEMDLNGVITNYTLDWGYSLPLNRSTSKHCSWDFSVKPQQNYTFNVSASTSVGKGLSLQCKQTIPPGAPLIAKNSEMMIKVESSSAVIDPEKQFRIDFDTTLVCNFGNGNIENHYVFVSESTQTSTNNVAEPFQGSFAAFKKDRLNKYQTWSAIEDADKISPYVASKSWNPCTIGHSGRRRRRATTQTVTFIVGEGGDCSGDCNGYVQPGKSYRVRVASCTAGGCSESEWSAAVKTEPNLVPSIVGGVVGALIAVAIFLAVMFVLRRRSLLCFRTDKESGFTELSGKTNIGYRGDSTEMVVVKARKIKVSEFAEKFYELSKDSNMKFSEEVKLLKEISPVHKTSCAEEQAVRIKNRYTNILAFDHSRVKLLPLDEEDGSDYINANYIPGHNSKREYIAAQGPLVCTKDDFWRMIWEQNVSVIVMLTQLVERGRRKCDQYWPEVVSEPFYFGDLIVRIDSESNLPDYVIRVISLQLNNRKKKMKQVHYLKWPDMGCPDTSWLLLNFVQDVRLFMPHQNPGPIVVHCSAGVGRTGTFIAVDHLIQKLNAGHQEVDIFNMVLGMRNERPNMVQTEDQYIFIHECIKDFLSSDEDEEEEEEDEEDEDNCEPIYENA
ncbi:tyrosine-protein phosphatase 10D-like isoform X2 [Mizuhopecten yessoensis]|uniref:tyrosine-protein phosphatase 10D-like isoform X2 n=1 Tax=Mizuhopecten yessoensis TaxID=6573 RepID=UPI000B458D36|nr:tyrosine-protein phosphatase 10D-like isoform X2 [Mizuhopecten yessoensis]